MSLGGRKGWMAGCVCCEGVGSRCEGAKDGVLVDDEGKADLKTHLPDEVDEVEGVEDVEDGEDADDEDRAAAAERDQPLHLVDALPRAEELLAPVHAVHAAARWSARAYLILIHTTSTVVSLRNNSFPVPVSTARPAHECSKRAEAAERFIRDAVRAT